MSSDVTSSDGSNFRKQLTDWAPVVSLVLLLVTSGAGFYSYLENRETKFYNRVDQMEESFQVRVDKSIGKLEGSLATYARQLEKNRIEGDIRLLTYAPHPLTESQELLLEDLERQMED